MNNPTHKLIKENIYSYNVINRNFQNLPYLLTKEKKENRKRKGERDDLHKEKRRKRRPFTKKKKRYLE